MVTTICMRRFAWLSLAVVLSGCGFAYDETLDSPYRLVAVDSMEQMGICRTPPEGGRDCLGDGLPSETVFAAGANARYLVAARRVTQEPFASMPKNYGSIEFYYIIRTSDEAAHGVPSANIVGPMSGPAFDRAKRELGLPEFSHVFDELR